MPDPRDLQLSSYDYPLPPERIAQAPVEPRHSARLLMAPPQGEPSMDAAHGKVWDLLEQLQPGDLLVVNDTRVLKARLAVRRSGGGLSELLVLEPRGRAAGFAWPVLPSACGPATASRLMALRSA